VVVDRVQDRHHHVRRAKGGEAATHPILGDELRAWRELKRQSASPFVFASERGGPFTRSGFAKLLARAGEDAKIGFKVHPHMLRHACGYALANKGIDTRTLQGLPRTSLDQLHDALRRAGSGSVQEHLGEGVAAALRDY
jgi:site-specific recombinase XerD